MVKLLYQGHGSYRIITVDAKVIYIDPFVGEGYDVPADLILVTHQHGDHNRLSLVTQKPFCRVITEKEALDGGKHNIFEIDDGIVIEAVEAKNINHNPIECVGFILKVDGKSVYASGDTSTTDQMSTFHTRELDYALLPCDGVYNMDLKEAANCAKIIGAEHNIPVHMKPGALFDRKRADEFEAPNKLILEPGQEIEL